MILFTCRYLSTILNIRKKVITMKNKKRLFIASSLSCVLLLLSAANTE
ncbi:succinyl-diaminopimelate desuccinylase, partial [Staphylococcus aureus]